MSQYPTILWFRQDLRLQDNSALQAAVELGAPILPIFIDDRAAAGDWALGEASRWFLHQGLGSLEQSIREAGGQLYYLQGDSLPALQQVIAATGSTRVFWNRRYEEASRATDAVIKKTFLGAGLEVKSFNSRLLNEPHTVSTGSGLPYKVYTPYWRKVKERAPESPVVFDAARADFYHGSLPGARRLEELELLPGHPWHRKLEAHWTVSESAAMAQLGDFLESAVEHYDHARDLPMERGTSRLSPYLHWGLIGPRQVMAALRSRAPQGVGPEVFSKEIYWREFAYHVLYHFPHTPDAPLQEKYADFPWAPDESVLRRWQRGQTGYPIVDAGMRELWATGWMHNRVRMIVSSLLVKHLLQDWRAGAQWFWDTLVDADLASNTLGWQWSGGCGADAAPYFRIFNPMTQGKKFDPEGAYVRKWVPELAALPDTYIHEPWEAPGSLLRQIGFRPGEDYPLPIIDHKEGRERALAAFAQVKAG